MVWGGNIPKLERITDWGSSFSILQKTGVRLLAPAMQVPECLVDGWRGRVMPFKLVAACGAQEAPVNGRRWREASV